LNKDYKNYAMLMKALGDENRAKIFDMLSQGERCACKILDEFSVTQSTLSYQKGWNLDVLYNQPR
jgi:ArsR family transcriptional regulator